MVYNSLVIAPQQKAKPLERTQTSEVDSLEKTSPPPTEGLKDDDEFAEIGSFRIRFSADQGIIKEIYSKTYDFAPFLSHFLDFSKIASLKSITKDSSEILFNFEGHGFQIENQIKAIDNNRIRFQIKITDLSNLKNVQFSLFDIDGYRVKGDKNKTRDSMLMEYSLLIGKDVIRKNNAFKFLPKEAKSEEKSVEWFGWRDRYHFALLEPVFKSKDYSIKWIDENKIRFEVTPSDIREESPEFHFNLYLGPQDLALLRSLDGNISKIMAFSGNPLLDAVEKFIYNILLLINKYIKNWGVSIILISLLIYGATYPLTIKSMLSMRKMQDLQPKMAELREKYKNDPQKLNTEVVQLYKIHNINPLAGCLPMLMQMPVFISLYQVLWRTHNFQGAEFLWIKDLSLPDRLMVFSKELPFIGNELNILPFLMSVVMFFQQKLSSKNMVVSDPSQEMQQKMMMYIFPIFIGGIFYHFASGLTLYFTIFYLLSTLTQYKMSKLGSLKK